MYWPHIVGVEDVQHIFCDGLCHQFRSPLCLVGAESVLTA